ncbi:unnamed protein product [Adineta steineri]|uniref:Uncharacterized protein n=1 Tax=Adineta steineri TaxID=433720 RepID=A0A813N3M6_9BILA|nr:unnamed protein product [Adineta steineri]CAF3707871.1 unnamed protein product [Adineta steineri]
MDPPHTHLILPTNATSAANPLAATTPTAIAHDTVIQTNREGDPLEYTEIITKENDSKPKSSSTEMTTKKTTTTTTTTTEEPTSKEYVVKEADVFKPLAVVSDTTPVNSVNNQIVGTTASGSLTTPGKIVGDMETIVAEHEKAAIVEPVSKKVTTTETTETTK